MKILIYFILIVAFLMFYSVSPVFTLVIIFVVVVVYGYFKLRKRNVRTGGRGMFGYGAVPQNSQVDNITTLLLLKVLMDNDNDSRAYDEKKDKEIKLAKKSEKKVLELLELN